jgi:hypothetical protein
MPSQLLGRDLWGGLACVDAKEGDDALQLLGRAMVLECRVRHYNVFSLRTQPLTSSDVSCHSESVVSCQSTARRLALRGLRWNRGRVILCTDD